MNEEQKFSVTMRPFMPLKFNNGELVIDVIASSRTNALIKARDAAYDQYPELRKASINFLGIEPAI